MCAGGGHELQPQPQIALPGDAGGVNVTSRRRDEVLGYLFLPRGFRIGEPVIERRGGCLAPGARKSIPLMDPNAHTMVQKSENSRFMDGVCCSIMNLDRETAMAAPACVEMRDIYASRTTGTWE